MRIKEQALEQLHRMKQLNLKPNENISVSAIS